MFNNSFIPMRVLDDAFTNVFGSIFNTTDTSVNIGDQYERPDFTQNTTKDNDTIYVDLPGCAKEDIVVTEASDRRYLRVVANRKAGREVQYGIYLKPYYGIEDIECSFDNGMLTIVSKPKPAAEPTTRKFDVK